MNIEAQIRCEIFQKQWMIKCLDMENFPMKASTKKSILNLYFGVVWEFVKIWIKIENNGAVSYNMSRTN